MAKESKYSAGDIYHEGVMLTGKSYMGERSVRYVEAICFCKKVFWTGLASLKFGSSKSCGCERRKAFALQATTHRLSTHPAYKRLDGIKQRCYNPKSASYKHYGERGITVCDEWMNDYETFVKWAIANGWQKGLTLERKDNNKGYSPDNCVWATYAVQNRNRRNNRIITAFGETKCLQDWVDDSRSVVKFDAISRRIKEGWIAEDAISIKTRN